MSFNLWTCSLFEERTQTEGCVRTGSLRKYFDLIEKVTGGWRELHNEVLHKLILQNIVRMVRSIGMS